ERVRASGARLTLLTPPPFDPEPVHDRVRPSTAERFSWVAPYAGYDQVLTRYAVWLVSLREPGVSVVDVHTPIRRYLDRARPADPAYRLAGDGVHLDATGHWLIARALLRAWDSAPEEQVAAVDLRRERATRGHVTHVSAARGVLQFDWEASVPSPRDPQ